MAEHRGDAEEDDDIVESRQPFLGPFDDGRLDGLSENGRASASIMHRVTGGFAWRRDPTRILRKMERKTRETMQHMTMAQKLFFIFFIAISATCGILFLIFHSQIFQALDPLAKRWREQRGGWAILFILIVLSAFPPLLGYSTCMTLAGLIYGFPNGWFVAASGTIVGSTLSFLTFRRFFASFSENLVNRDRRFAAFTMTLKQDGFKLLCLIRLCPLPYSVSNAGLSTVSSVSWLQFLMASCVAAPKLLIHVFIGSRLANLAGDAELDSKARIINYLSLTFGIVLGVVTGVIIYRQTSARVKIIEEQRRLVEQESNDRRRGGYLNMDVDDGLIDDENMEERAIRLASEA